MKKIIKNTLLDYIPSLFNTENIVNNKRIFELNQSQIAQGDVVYLMERDLRFKDNFSLNFAIFMAQKLDKKLRIIHVRQHFQTELKKNFYKEQLEELKKQAKDFDFKIYDKFIGTNIGVLILDFSPILNRDFLKNICCKVFEVDAHNIVPARFVSNKQEYNAATFRRKIYYNIYEFLTEFSKSNLPKTIAELELENFIQNKLDFYAELKNEPAKDVTSNLSKFFNLGFLSVQRTALEVIKSNSSKENKEAFLEELIVRGGLSDNFCLYGSNYKSFDGIPNWAKATLEKHSKDFRQYIYTKYEFENVQTYDELWNYAEGQLLMTGKIHGYLRMFWAKKILEWSINPDEALKIAIYLNDKYALDAPSPNGYVGILWTIGALHDRAFQERPIIGKIRPMSGRKIKLQ